MGAYFNQGSGPLIGMIYPRSKKQLGLQENPVKDMLWY